MRRFTLSLGLALPAFALAATPTFTVLDLGTAPGIQWAPVPPMVGNSAASLGSFGGGITLIFQQTSNAAVGESALADNLCTGNGALFHAFLFVNGTLQDLGTLGGCASAALSLNASHTVVGWAQTAGPTVADAGEGGLQIAFVWQNGTMQPLPSLFQTPHSPAQAGADGSIATGINNAGEIVGATAQLLNTGEIASRAALWENSTVAKPLELQFQVGSLSGSVIFTNATGINCQGNIAVTGYPLNHSPADVHAYLLVRQGPPRSCPE